MCIWDSQARRPDLSKTIRRDHGAIKRGSLKRNPLKYIYFLTFDFVSSMLVGYPVWLWAPSLGVRAAVYRACCSKKVLISI